MKRIDVTMSGTWVTLNEYINAERSNRFKAAKMKKDEMERMMWTLKGLPASEGKIHLVFKAFVPNQRKDPDNLYVYFCKSFLDSLVALKILPNDGQKNVGRIVFEPVEIGEERMEIIISPSAFGVRSDKQLADLLKEKGYDSLLAL